MNVRLEQFLAAENISQAQFADSINVARASVSHILSGRNKPGFDFISSMIRRYPTLNIDWLITGRGKMYKNGTDAPVEQIPPTVDSTAQNVQPAQKSQFTDDDDLLFTDIETVTPPVQNQPESVQSPTDVTNSASLIETISLNKIKELTENQRKAVKVIIFYSDGTFQEL